MKLASRVIIICLIATSLICLSACVGEKAGNEIQIIEHTLSIHEFRGDVLQSIASVDGKAKNTSILTLSSASIIVNFYDKDNNFLQTASTMKQNLVPGEIWHFNIKFTGPDAWKTVHYDISTSVNR